MDKEQIIGDAFNKYSNFGNVAETLEDARKVDKSITRKDVMAYKNKYYIPLRYHRGVNSYVAKQPKAEYRPDVLQGPGQKDEGGPAGTLYGGAAGGGHLHEVLRRGTDHWNR